MSQHVGGAPSPTKTFPCGGCGAPLPVVLAEVRCRRCGRAQRPPREVEAALRRHAHEVDATLELADYERRWKDPYVRIYAGICGFGLLSMLVGGCGFVVRAPRVGIVGLILGLGVMLLTAPLSAISIYRRRREPVPADRVRCASCGAVLPFDVTEISVTCAFCGADVHITAEGRARAIQAAEGVLARESSERR